MDIVVLIFYAIMTIFAIGLFSILPVLAFLLYRFLKKKGKIQKKIGLTIFILTTLLMIGLALKTVLGPSGFGPDYDTVVIEQKIGGKLLCYSVHTADLQSWYFDVDYKYININGDTFDFNRGEYMNMEWEKNEQLFKFDKFLILNTGAWNRSIKLIIKNIYTDSTKIFEIDDNFIENDSLWQSQKIKSLLNYCCGKVSFDTIKDNEILIKYKFRTNKHVNFLYDRRVITYQIVKETGDIKMTKIK